jgi:hypothetical protein
MSRLIDRYEARSATARTKSELLGSTCVGRWSGDAAAQFEERANGSDGRALRVLRARIDGLAFAEHGGHLDAAAYVALGLAIKLEHELVGRGDTLGEREVRW